MAGPTLRATSLSLAAPDPRALAEFYAALLGVRITVTEPPRPGYPPEDGWAQIRPDGAGPTLNFEYEPTYVPVTWPSEAGRQQVQAHLDIAVDDLPAAVDHALGVGATLADFQPQDDVRVLFDPAGHPFCLFLSPGHANATSRNANTATQNADTPAWGADTASWGADTAAGYLGLRR
ncbi:hypothetical protein BJF85_08505 [Saccharomonospora sp. CUA-673]|uniref:VOC family protein n=1 Tax=Saccharomonospora sp. CUA-673 TaxID=1904969 RepID=UPI0009685700|nr:VOC family protein [Saccharomonospora sp. CUA-673]OLT38716.1 hypothetical protein BJF85_08505 [Saccharomonospora sp. CUA-673]